MKRYSALPLAKGRNLHPFACLFLALLLMPTKTYSQLKNEKLPDGVEHWYLDESTSGESYLSRRFKEIYNVVFSKPAQPFGRSVAFIAGVSAYRDLPSLPSVRNDVTDMRYLLLTKAGFDEVYVAADDVVNRDTIEQYVKETIAARLQRSDRLLFYYSGHGGDNHGKTGYLLFGGAHKGQFWGPQVLAIDTLTDWSRELSIQHILIILDSCASGEGIAPKSSGNESSIQLIQTLSGKGSRTILTAGTGDEATYAVEDRESSGHGVFTKAFLNAFESLSLADRNGGFITITDLFAEVEKEIAKYRAKYAWHTTPRMWTLQETDYGGTFVFLNPRSKSANLTEEQAKVLAVKPGSKKDGGATGDPGSGIIQVFSAQDGALYLDDLALGYMVRGKTRQFLQQAPGEHQIRMQEETRRIKVESGKITYATFGLKSPLDDSGSIPVGTLVVDAIHVRQGEVFVDDFRVGELDKNARLRISHLTAGTHNYRIEGLKETESGAVSITPNQIEYTILRPAPPSNLTVTVN